MNKRIMQAAQFLFLLVSSGCGAPAEGAQAGDGEFDNAESESALSFTGDWFYDAGSTCTVTDPVGNDPTTMHCCPPGSAMIGVHVKNNVFKCKPLALFFPPRLDQSTFRNGMHACPQGEIMVGLHANLNRLACQFPQQAVTFEYVDGNPPTNDAYPMHVCSGSDMAMSGIHINHNLLTCAR